MPLFFILLLLSQSIFAQESLHVAVATNFFKPLKTISEDFTAQTGIQLKLSSGSTGSLTAQILRGAPYDIFFAADDIHPVLIANKLHLNSAITTYAQGKLIVLSTYPTTPNLSKLNIQNINFFALANPKTSPYGSASQHVLTHYGLYIPLKKNKKIALGSNIGKAFRFFQSGNAQIAMVAATYQKTVQNALQWEVPSDLHPPITQQAIILKPSVDAEKLMRFILSKTVQAQLKTMGYR